MRKLLTILLDVIFPPSLHQQQLRQSEATAQRLYDPYIYKGITCLSHYQERSIQAAVIENKFHREIDAAQLLAEVLQQWTIAKTDELLFVPIPLGSKRLRLRGHNQVETIIARVRPKQLVESSILQRQIETTPQSQLPKDSRIQNVKNAFVCDQTHIQKLTGKHIVLIDDVVTTGATMTAARAALTPYIPASCTLTCLAIAH